MCMHEPYCWTQLDWQSADPPAWQCGSTQRLLFWQMSFHNSAASDSVALLEQGLGVHHTAHICGTKSAEFLATIYNYSFTQCAMANKQAFDMSWAVKSSSKLRDAKAQYLHETPQFEKVDALLFSFSASMWENYMSVADEKVLVLSLWHRMNMFRCSPDEARDNIRAAQTLASTRAKRPHILGPQTLYDVEYMRHYTGINPIFLPTTLIDAVGVRGRRMWNENRKIFLWNAHLHRGVPGELTSLAKTSGHTYAAAPRNYRMEDLALYAGVVYLPYSVTNGKIVEQYAMSVPLFVPSVEFAMALDMFDDRTMDRPYCSNTNDFFKDFTDPGTPYEHSPNADTRRSWSEAAGQRFWIGFADIYHWPCVVQFDSWDHLDTLLTETDRMAVSQCMWQANKWRHFEAKQNWCWATAQIAAGRTQDLKRTSV